MSSCCCQITDTTATVPLATLMRHAVPYISAAPQALGLDLIRQNYIEFCRRSGVLTQELTLDVLTGQTSYPLVPAEGYEVYMLREAHDHNLFERPDYWPSYYGFPFRYKLDSNQALVLQSAPTQDTPAGIKVEISLLPESCVTNIPTALSTPFGRGIALGAVADLMEIPNKEWTHMGLAERIRRRYYETVQSAKNMAMSNRQTGPIQFKRMRVV